MAERTVTCAWCRAEFTAIRKDAKFCSRMCHWHFQKGPVPERKCLWCDGSMDGKRRGSLYCSPQHKKNAGGRRFNQRNNGYYKQYHDTERMRAWKEANRERHRVMARERRRNATPEERSRSSAKATEWRVANRVYYQVRQRNRSAMKKNNPGSVGVSVRDWLRLCRRHHYRCAYCGIKPATALEMDHVIPLIKGGRHAIGNILPACRRCNLSKNARYLIDWRSRECIKYQWETAA